MLLLLLVSCRARHNCDPSHALLHDLGDASTPVLLKDVLGDAFPLHERVLLRVNQRARGRLHCSVT